MRFTHFACFLLVLAPALSSAQRHRDPLTSAEIDQIRDTSWEPRLRLPLYVQFARARLVKLEEVRSDAKSKDRAKQTHDLLDDFQLLYDELNDNIDTYVERKNDIRKPLKLIVDADTEFQAKLRGLKDAADVRSTKSWSKIRPRERESAPSNRVKREPNRRGGAMNTERASRLPSFFGVVLLTACG